LQLFLLFSFLIKVVAVSFCLFAAVTVVKTQ